MSTVVLDAYSKAYPSITNRIRAAVFSESDPLAVVASIIDAVSGHPQRIWHFPGLPRDNYIFSLDEIDGSGNPINNLALFDVVPGQIDGSLTRKDEQPQVSITPGFTAGTSTFTFDGTGGKPNYIGWDIVPSELTGRGILVRGLDYSWDYQTGIFTLLQPGDVFGTLQYYNIHFEPQGTQSVPDSVPTIFDFATRVITSSENILTGDFGTTLIVDPAGQYIELTLPNISTVAKGRLLTIEVAPAIGKDDLCCVKIIGTVNFMRGALYLMSNETVQIWKLRRADLSTEWRIRNAPHGCLHCGSEVDDEFTQALTSLKLWLNGAIIDNRQFARLYNEVVLNLPGTQVVNYDDWATGNNKYFYSLANSSNPSNANKFHLPDRRGLFARNNNTGKAGDYSANTVKISPLIVNVEVGDSFTGAAGSDWTGALPSFGPILGRGFASHSQFQLPLGSTGGTGTETKPENYLINKYVIV